MQHPVSLTTGAAAAAAQSNGEDGRGAADGRKKVFMGEHELERAKEKTSSEKREEMKEEAGG